MGRVFFTLLLFVRTSLVHVYIFVDVIVFVVRDDYKNLLSLYTLNAMQKTIPLLNE